MAGNDADDEVARTAISCRRGSVIAAAGCGKTEQIARATALSGGRRLILTHTNAGADALRIRLVRNGVSKARYRVDTIAGWCLRYAASFPQRSGLTLDQPDEDEWNLVYSAAEALLLSGAADRVLAASYEGVFIDEYQDCTATQHRVIGSLSEHLPTCIFGDPLQAIFDFANQPPVAWEVDVFPLFPQVGELTTPHRWHRAGSHRIADWLGFVRKALERGDPISFQDLPEGVAWDELPANGGDRTSAITRACFAAHRRADSASLVTIADRASIGTRTLIARQLSRVGFTNIEPVGCAPLFEAANRIDGSQGRAKLDAVLSFAGSCMTNARSQQLLQAVDSHLIGRRRGRTEFGDLIDFSARVVTDGSSGAVSDLLVALPKRTNVNVYCRERYYGMQRAIANMQTKGSGSLREHVWEMQNRFRHAGRKIGRRSVGNTLLVKGLEFGHAVVVHSNSMSDRDWYVALTRGVHSVHILSPTNELKRTQPSNNAAEQ